MKILTKGIWKTSQLVNTQRFWEDGALREGKEALCSFPHILPYASILSGCFLVVTFYNKLVI